MGPKDDSEKAVSNGSKLGVNGEKAVSNGSNLAVNGEKAVSNGSKLAVNGEQAANNGHANDIQVVLQLPDGRRQPIAMGRDDRVNDIKLKFQKLSGMYSHMQRLSCNGASLDDKMLLSEGGSVDWMKILLTCEKDGSKHDVAGEQAVNNGSQHVPNGLKRKHEETCQEILAQSTESAEQKK